MSNSIVSLKLKLNGLKITNWYILFKISQYYAEYLLYEYEEYF